MTQPVRSPIADAAAAAMVSWQSSEARKAEVIAAARAALGKVLGPRVPLEALETTVEAGELVVVTDQVVTLAVRTDGQVFTVERSGSGWVMRQQVTTARELAQALPPAVMENRRG